MNLYFSITMDERITKAIKLTHFTQEDFLREQPIIKEIDTTVNFIYIDYIKLKILFQYYYIFSDRLKEVFQMYDNSIFFQPILLTDKKEGIQKLYWNAKIETIENIIQNISSKEMITLKKEKIKGKKIFIVREDKQENLIIDLYMTESILRRQLLGLKYYPIKLE